MGWPNPRECPFDAIPQRADVAADELRPGGLESRDASYLDRRQHVRCSINVVELGSLWPSTSRHRRSLSGYREDRAEYARPACPGRERAIVRCRRSSYRVGSMIAGQVMGAAGLPQTLQCRRGRVPAEQSCSRQSAARILRQRSGWLALEDPAVVGRGNDRSEALLFGTAACELVVVHHQQCDELRPMPPPLHT